MIATQSFQSPGQARGIDATQDQLTRSFADPLHFPFPPFHPIDRDNDGDAFDSINGCTHYDDVFDFSTQSRPPPSRQVQLPGHIIGGKMINTPKGLAFLAPSENVVQTPDGTAILVLTPNPSSEERLSIDKVADQGGCRDGKHWSPNEDAILEHAVQGTGALIDWKVISSQFFAGARSSNSVSSFSSILATKTLILYSQCKHRWRKIDPSSNTAEFTEVESAIIIQQRSQGKSWSDIAKNLGNRTSNQVKFHFEKIDPSRKRSKWSPAEDEFLIAARSRHGNKWVKISELLPGRSANDVKNRWNYLCRHDDSLRSLKQEPKVA